MKEVLRLVEKTKGWIIPPVGPVGDYITVPVSSTLLNYDAEVNFKKKLSYTINYMISKMFCLG